MRGSKLVACASALTLLAACEHSDLVATEPSVITTGAPLIVGSGVSATEIRALADFSAVSVSAPFRVELVPGGAPGLELTADDNVLPLVRSEVRDGRLFLGFTRPTSLTRTREILCRATLGELREAEASGAAVLELRAIATERLVVRLSGASLGSGSGTVGGLTLDVSGASRWSAPSLRASSAEATVSGASFVLQRVVESLRAEVSGASTLEYLGDPAVVSNVSGVSVVRRAGP